MKRLFTIGALVAAALWLGAAPGVTESRADDPQLGWRMGARTVVVAGRRVTVEVSARRNFTPLADPQGRLQASVYLVSQDGQPLPGITNVKLSLTHRGSRWSPVLALLPSDVASERFYVAQRGPLWPVNAVVTANVEIRTNGSATRFALPVMISASRSFAPVAR